MSEPFPSFRRPHRSKLLKQAIEYARSLGFEDTDTAGGHVKLFKAGCQPVFCSATPSDHRAVKNIICDINRSHRGAQCQS
ncbi:type II toxin-antitoxin system HicA family toxin [Sinorhizobium medicae]|nr:type II toxin-antitoxin system HicA family toxin [Sinorhizobium medicae]